LFARVGCFDEEVDQRRVGADPVQRHLDAGDVRVGGRLVEKALDRRERVERVMDEDILLANGFEHVAVGGGAPDRSRREGRILQMRQRQAMERHPLGEIEPAVGARDHSLVLDLEVLHQDVQHPLRHGRLDLKQRRIAVAQLLERPVDGLEKVSGTVVLNLHVRVADDAE
jgi:hypothetical protein